MIEDAAMIAKSRGSAVCIALVLSAAFGTWACGTKRADAPAAATPPAPAASPAAAADAPAAAPAALTDKLIGRWLRADSNYVIEVRSAAPDGTLEAAYFNPGPIQVSRALWKIDGQHVGMFVELTDRNYPGNYYELLYDAGSDALVGRYSHLGVQEVYEVAFSRVAAAP